MDKNEQEIRIRELKKELNWYLHDASYDEFDLDKVSDLTDELNGLCYKSLDSFQLPFFLEQLLQDDDFAEYERYLPKFERVLKILSIIFPEEKAEKFTYKYIDKVIEKDKTKKEFKLPKAALVSISAACLVATLFIGGTIGVYGAKSGYFIGKDYNEVVTSPDSFYGETTISKTFESLKDLPAKYVTYTWTPSGVPVNCVLSNIDVTDCPIFIKVRCSYQVENSDIFLSVTQRSYKDNINKISQPLDGFKLIEDETIGGIIVEYSYKKNDDYTEYSARFSYNNSIYMLNSNLELDAIKNIIGNSINKNNF